jgi:hypothetical protein
MHSALLQKTVSNHNHYTKRSEDSQSGDVYAHPLTEKKTTMSVAGPLPYSRRNVKNPPPLRSADPCRSDVEERVLPTIPSHRVS